MESSFNFTSLKRKDSGELPAECCVENAQLPEINGAGTASHCFFSIPLPHVSTWKVYNNLKWLFPEESFNTSGNIAS